jgi:hypothetical protein
VEERGGWGEEDADGGADAGRTGDGTGRDFLHVTSTIIGPVQVGSWKAPGGRGKLQQNQINPNTCARKHQASPISHSNACLICRTDRQTGGRKAQTAPVPGSHGASRRLTAAASALAFTLRPRASRAYCAKLSNRKSDRHLSSLKSPPFTRSVPSQDQPLSTSLTRGCRRRTSRRQLILAIFFVFSFAFSSSRCHCHCQWLSPGLT